MDCVAGTETTGEVSDWYTGMYRSDGVIADVRDKVKRQTQMVVDRYIGKMEKKPAFFRNDEAIEQAKQKKDALVGYISEVILGYNVPHYDAAGKEIGVSESIKNLQLQYFGSPEENMPEFEVEAVVRDIIYDFRKKTDDLAVNEPTLEGVKWKHAYMKMVSDAYGGVTNDQITDGAGHSARYFSNGELYSFSNVGYWYGIDGDTGKPCVNAHFFAMEPWAEYTECKLMDSEGRVKCSGGMTLPRGEMGERIEAAMATLMEYAVFPEEK